MITDAYLDFTEHTADVRLIWEGIQLSIPVYGNKLLRYWGDRQGSG